MKIIIPGPCAAESKEQIRASINEAKKRKIKFLRVPLWKPRTKPGFDGMGEKGIELLLEAKKAKIIPATEVMTPDHVRVVLASVPDSEIIFWLGARNQNHFTQKEIANLISENKKAILIIKNQPWPSEDHWLGIVEHIRETKIKDKNIILCHRGFFPPEKNPRNYRNLPDCKMAMSVKKRVNLPMLFDPSHIGGSVSNVFEVIKECKRHSFDGMMIEVHPNPSRATTDKKQQLSWSDFDSIRNI